MFPILNVSNNFLISRNNQMSNLKEQINSMTPEQVSTELALSRSELSRTHVMRVLLWVIFGVGILYLMFGI